LGPHQLKYTIWFNSSSYTSSNINWIHWKGYGVGVVSRNNSSKTYKMMFHHYKYTICGIISLKYNEAHANNGYWCTSKYLQRPAERLMCCLFPISKLARSCDWLGELHDGRTSAKLAGKICGKFGNQISGV
jgi:hypothetical protein